MAKNRNYSDSQSLKIILILGILGLLLSIYLIFEHYSSGENRKSACDLAERISCTAVLTSEYAQLFSVPIAFFGVTWNLFLIFFSLKIIQENITIIDLDSEKEKSSRLILYMWISALLLWIIGGIIFVFYLVAAELILGAICPLCTIIHIFTFIEFYYSWKLFNGLKYKPLISIDNLINTFRYWFIVIAVVHLLLFVFFNLPKNVEYSPEAVDKIASCLTENKIYMFGSSQCSHCIEYVILFYKNSYYLFILGKRKYLVNLFNILNLLIVVWKL